MGCEIAGVFLEWTHDDRTVKHLKLVQRSWEHMCLKTGGVMHIVSEETAEWDGFLFCP